MAEKIHSIVSDQPLIGLSTPMSVSNGPLAVDLHGKIGNYVFHMVSISTAGFPYFLTDNT